MTDIVGGGMSDSEGVSDIRTRIAADPLSVQLRLDGDGVTCDWGAIDNPDGNPALRVGPLMVVTGGVVRALLRDGPSMDEYGNVNSVRYAEGSFFFDAVTTDRTERRWTWKLFPARWWDGDENDDLFVGRWMD